MFVQNRLSSSQTELQEKGLWGFRLRDTGKQSQEFKGDDIPQIYVETNRQAFISVDFAAASKIAHIREHVKNGGVPPQSVLSLRQRRTIIF